MSDQQLVSLLFIRSLLPFLNFKFLKKSSNYSPQLLVLKQATIADADNCKECVMYLHNFLPHYKPPWHNLHSYTVTNTFTELCTCIVIQVWYSLRMLACTIAHALHEQQKIHGVLVSAREIDDILTAHGE